MAHKAEDLLDQLDETARSDDTPHVEDFVDAFGNRGSGAFLVIPALIGVSPVAAIPSMPTIIAAVTLLFAAQIAWGRERFWLPKFIEGREISGEKLSKFADKGRGVARWLDGHFGQRLPALTGETGTRIAGGVCALLCLFVMPLELLPFAAALPFATIGLIGIALTLKDGVVMAAALALAAFAIGLAGWTLLF